MGLLTRRDARATRRDERIDTWLTTRAAVDLRRRWREATTRAGLGRPMFTPLGGASIAGLPQVVHVHPAERLGDSAYLLVSLPAGMLVEDLEYRADELATGLGVWGVRFTPRGVDHVRVDLVDVDPLAQVVPFLPACPAGHVVLGVGEHGQVVTLPLDDLTHVVVQGATRSGKTAALYSLLAQLAQRPDVDVAGIDPTGLLLGPWGPHPRGWRACGTEDAAARYLTVIGALVAEMDRRIAAMPPRCDVTPTGPDCPLIVVVLEEWAAVARLVGHTRTKPSDVHRLTARLLAEGAKAGIRVVTLVQRAEADVVGAFERDQALTRLSYGCADANTLKMLHPDVSNDLAALHAVSPKGVALLSMPGVDLLRLRSPWIGGYGAYCDAVAPPAGTTGLRAVAA